MTKHTLFTKMATFLAVPLKQTQEVELIKPLRSFIQNTFSQVEPDDYNHALNEFSKLRNLMIAKSVDKHESALEVLYRFVLQTLLLIYSLNGTLCVCGSFTSIVNLLTASFNSKNLSM